MTTTAPLPALGDLAALLAQGPGDDALARPWRHADEAAFWLSRGAWAMQAVALWWGRTHGGDKASLWLPDYFCNQSTAPLRQGGTRLTFYPIDGRLEPDWPACERLAAAAPPDLFVLVHYFGRPADGARAQEFCRPLGARLIEDAAHALAPGPGIGDHGDFVFYSPHKVLAVPDGSLLLMRGGDAQTMGEVVAGLGTAAPSPWPWLARRLVQKALPGSWLAARTRRRGPAFADDPPYAPYAPLSRPSGLARRLLARQVGRLDTIAALRRANAAALGAALDKRPGCRILECPDHAVPYRLVLDCDDAPALYADLRRRGCPAETWPDLPPEVLADGAAHGTALALRQRLLLLPVHQSAAPGSLIAWGA